MLNEPARHPRTREIPRLDPESGRVGGWAVAGAIEGLDPVECVDVEATPHRIERGRWFVVAEFDGPIRAWRFARHRRVERRGHSGRGTVLGTGDPVVPPWCGPAPGAWTSSLDRGAYIAAVERVRDAVREGDVYQANVCRVLRAPLAGTGPEPDARALRSLLTRGNPAPYGAAIHVRAGEGIEPVWIVSASPELYLHRDGDAIVSGPIKGTAPVPDGLRDKDRAENVMIVDLVRNDLHRVSVPGTVDVPDLLAIESHPGLVHLVSRVHATLRPGTRWADILAATFPPASVSGAPKLAALDLIGELEPVPRGPYCGAIGWVDGDRGRAQLAVGIRTFWWRGGELRFGTGAGITWGSSPQAEWDETELKASRLIALASGTLEP